MKKITLFILAFTFCMNYSHAQKATRLTDSIQIQRISAIEYNLTEYYKENRTSQKMLFVGSALFIAGYFLGASSDLYNPLLISGGVCSLVGGVVYLDSFKWLNSKPKKKPKQHVIYY